ncbi:unnamed protein product [Amaranthus hypochondriacus]
MAIIYNLDEDPNMYITPSNYGNRFVYKMVTFVRDSFTKKVIRNIDLRKDKLMIYETEIKEKMLKRLYDSLTLGNVPKMGHIYVNCLGACYFFVTGKGICKPIYNIIFDWSKFEVIIPNSLNDSLRKQLDCSKMENEDMIMKVKKLEEELSRTKNELEASRRVMETSRKEVNEVKDYDYEDNCKNELLEKISNYIDTIDCKVKSTNKKLDEALISQLWMNNRDDDLGVYIKIEDIND